MGTYTSNLNLYNPAEAETGWKAEWDTNFSILDTAIGTYLNADGSFKAATGEAIPFSYSGYSADNIKDAILEAGAAASGAVWGTFIGTLSNQTDLQTALDARVVENSAIVAATKTKITYDTKGLVTSGADATTADIADSTDARYVTDAQLVVIGNTSGTNTGDNTVCTSGAATTAVTLLTARTIAGVSFDGSANISLNNNAITNGAGYTTNTGDMVLASIQSVTGLKTFDTSKLAIKGSSTGTNIVAAANSSGTDYTNTLPAKTGTFAMTSDITGTNSGTNTGDNAVNTLYSGLVSNVPTSLSVGTVTATTVSITSDGAVDDVTIPAATTDDAGLLTAAKFDEIVANTAKVTNTDQNLYATVIGDTGTTTATSTTDTIDIEGGTGITTVASTDKLTVTLDSAGVDTDTVPFSGSGMSSDNLTDAVLEAYSNGGGGYTNLTEFIDQTAWRVFYSNASGDVTELALGADGTYLKSNGASAAPTFDSPSGAGDVVGPASSVDENIPVFDSTSGKILKDSGINKSAITANTAKNTNVPTALSVGTVTSTTVSITSDGGADDVTIPAATTDDAGLLTAAKFDEIVANTAKVTNVSTNITVVEAPTNVEIQSSDGTNDTIAAADETNAGVMTTTMYDNHILNNAKVSNVSTTLSVGTVGVNTVAITSDGGADDVTLPAATVSTAGMLTTAKWAEIVANTAKVTNVPTSLSIGTVTSTTVSITSDGAADDVTIPAATTDDAGLLTAALFDEIDANTAKVSNVSTSLSTGTVTSTSYGITSDGGVDDVVLAQADTNNAGLLSAAKWDEIVANTAKVSNVSTSLSLGTVTSTTVSITSDGGADDVTLPAATTDDAGLLTAALFDEIDANTAKVTNATHTGDVTGSTTLTIGAGKVTEAMQILADNTTNDVSSAKHGYAPKGDGSTTKFLNANGAYSTPASGSAFSSNSGGTSFSDTFTSADLGSGYVLTIEHNLGYQYCTITVYDNNGDLVDVEATAVDADTMTIQFYSGWTITGTWAYTVTSPTGAVNLVDTTDDTETTLATIPTSSNAAYHITATIVARQTNSANETNTYVLDFAVKNNAGTVTLGTIQNTYTDEDEADWSVTAEVNTVSGSTDEVLLLVTGATSDNVSWKSSHTSITI